MAYLDAHGRPELVMHPDIKRGIATVRIGPDGGHESGDPTSIMAAGGRNQESQSGGVAERAPA